MEVVDLIKRYPRSPVDAVAGISFGVAPGESLGLLGPNGAGKTTTVAILTTRVRASRGTARVGGVDVASDPVGARRMFGVVPQRNNLDRSLSVRKNLTFHARYHGVPRRERNERASILLDEFGLTERADEKPDLFSGGQTQRMMIARALMHAPAVLFLDEPSTGLDPAARRFLWEQIDRLKGAGTTIVLTTHDMHEAARLADRVGIMDQGRILALDTPAALIAELRGVGTLELDLGIDGGVEPSAITDALTGLANVERGEIVPEASVLPRQGGPGRALVVRLYVNGEGSGLMAPVVETLTALGVQLVGVRFADASLEDVFLRLTGKALR